MDTDDKQLMVNILQMNLTDLKYGPKPTEQFTKRARKLFTQKYSHVKVTGTCISGWNGDKNITCKQHSGQIPDFRKFFHHFGDVLSKLTICFDNQLTPLLIEHDLFRNCHETLTELNLIGINKTWFSNRDEMEFKENRKVIKTFLNVKKLSLYACRMSFSGFLSIFRWFPVLERLEIISCTTVPANMTQVINKHFPDLKHLKMFGEPSTMKIDLMGKFNFYSHLKSLSIDVNQLESNRDEIFCLIQENIPNLECMELNNLTEAAFYAPNESLNLKKLTISQKNADNLIGLTALTQMHFKQLEELEIKTSWLNGIWIDFILRMKSLTRLTIRIYATSGGGRGYSVNGDTFLEFMNLPYLEEMTFTQRVVLIPIHAVQRFVRDSVMLKRLNIVYYSWNEQMRNKYQKFDFGPTWTVREDSMAIVVEKKLEMDPKDILASIQFELIEIPSVRVPLVKPPPILMQSHTFPPLPSTSAASCDPDVIMKITNDDYLVKFFEYLNLVDLTFVLTTNKQFNRLACDVFTRKFSQRRIKVTATCISTWGGHLTCKEHIHYKPDFQAFFYYFGPSITKLSIHFDDQLTTKEIEVRLLQRCNSLIELKLSGLKKDKIGFKKIQFSKVEKLSLHTCRMPLDAFDGLFSWFPAVNQLELINCSTASYWEHHIHGKDITPLITKYFPNLQHFKMFGEPTSLRFNITECNLGHSLRTLSLGLNQKLSNTGTNTFRVIPWCLSELESLELYHLRIPFQDPIETINLKKLKLSQSVTMEKIFNASQRLNHFRQLEDLEIESPSFEDFPSFVLHLTTIKRLTFRTFVGRRDLGRASEVTFLRFAELPNLEEITFIHVFIALSAVRWFVFNCVTLKRFVIIYHSLSEEKKNECRKMYFGPMWAITVDSSAIIIEKREN